MNITINKELSVPVHKQIYSQIALSIANGNFENRDKLLPERELAEKLSVSRGTVKKAYEQLVYNGYAIAEQGAGTFVMYLNNSYPMEDNTIKDDIDSIIDKLLEEGFEYNEINSLFKMRILNKKNLNKNVNIAAIDCNLETLSIVRNQISDMDNINYMVFLLKDVMEYKNPSKIFSEFDLIFTTSTHYDDLKTHIKDHEDKIVKGIMSIDRETIMQLATIDNPEKVGIVSKSERFAEIINHNLEEMDIFVPEENYVLISDLTYDNFENFVVNKSKLIFPPLYTMDLEKRLSDKIFEYNHNGGGIITFNYTIERGSIIYIEEKIINNLNKI